MYEWSPREGPQVIAQTVLDRQRSSRNYAMNHIRHFIETAPKASWALLAIGSLIFWVGIFQWQHYAGSHAQFWGGVLGLFVIMCVLGVAAVGYWIRSRHRLRTSNHDEDAS